MLKERTVWNERQPRPFNEQNLDTSYVHPQYRVDLRRFSEKEYNKFVKMNTVSDWSLLSWKDIGKPYEVSKYSKERTDSFLRCS
jgi:hypothetical protein